MAKKKGKRTYHRPPAQINTVQRPVRLSQCMIVKNEEKNIEKALSWAKPIAFEQIVVDTGSTDRTVEIAERMGAKVYHFEWINDFSAAKNYAIEQAKGDWIAFLDADEYFSEVDARKLMELLNMIRGDASYNRMRTAIICPWVQIDDNGRPFLVLTQQRIFRNVPEIRYEGSIHESLTVPEQNFNAPELSIMHTGYSATSYADTGKAERNIELIKVELEKDPENVDLKCYLADSLRATGDADKRAEAEALYREILASGKRILRELKEGAYNYLIATYFDNELKSAENFEYCKKAYEEFPKNPDFCYYYGRKLQISGDYQAAWDKMTECENILKNDSIEGRAEYIMTNPVLLFFQMVLIAEELGNVEEIIRCATLLLKEDKYQHEMLAPYIAAFNREGYKTPADEIFALLGKLYDFNNTRDKLTVMNAAKKAINDELVQIILDMLTQEELSWLTESQK